MNPGIMWTVRAASVGIPWMARWAEAVDCLSSPVAVRRMAGLFPVVLLITGAVGVK